MINCLRRLWRTLRYISGDDAYERYLQHMQTSHPGEAVMDRRAFFKAEQERKWGKVRRCC